jgi:hypothetical protein
MRGRNMAGTRMSRHGKKREFPKMPVAESSDSKE